MPAYDATALRLTAARNLGITAGFRVATRRDFTGSILDFQQLSTEQKQAVSAEMYRLIRERPQDYPAAVVTTAQAGSFADFKNVPEPLSPGAAALVGAGEGLVNLPQNIGLAGAAVVRGAGTIVRAAGTELGGAVNATAGSLLGVKVSTLAWVALGGVFLYFLANSGAGAKAAAYTVERVLPRRNPCHRRRRR